MWWSSGVGYIGLSVGYHLKRLKPNIDVRVIESDVCGYGASGRNGGFSMTTCNGMTIAEIITGQKTSRTEMFFCGPENHPLAPRADHLRGGQCDTRVYASGGLVVLWLTRSCSILRGMYYEIKNQSNTCLFR